MRYERLLDLHEVLMNNLMLSDEISKELFNKLVANGYKANRRKVYISFDKGLSDKVYIHYSNNIIRARKKTTGEQVITERFGSPNGRASASQEDILSSWFFNGYTGKKGSSV